MAMTTRAGLDCHALKISLQRLPAGIPAQHLGAIVNAVCGNGTINYLASSSKPRSSVSEWIGFSGFFFFSFGSTGILERREERLLILATYFTIEM